MKSKNALITGITGQDGSYLAEFLKNKGYQVYGLVSKNFSVGNQNIKQKKNNYHLIPGDLLDKKSLEEAMAIAQPDEVYNLAAITFVPDSWQKTSLVIDINTVGTTRILEIIMADYPQTKFYQASSAKMFGHPNQPLATENTPLQPIDPYGISKAAAHQMIGIYRRQNSLFAVSGILFNHESERRGKQFVTRKITQGAVKIKLGLAKQIILGDLNAQADWGYAPDYIKAIYAMMQAQTPTDYIVATGHLHSVADICQTAFEHLNLNWQKYVKTDPKFLRRVPNKPLVGDYSKIKSKLGWHPQTSFEQMIKQMVTADLELLSKTHTN